MRFILFAFFVLFLISVEAQYWVGPKVGYHYTVHDYQSPSYDQDYKISNDHNFEAGVVVTYTASERYAVHGELYFEQIGNHVRNKREENFFVDSKSSFHYLSLPVLLRVSVGKGNVHWYFNGGPKLSYWIGGNGVLQFTDDGSIRLDGIEEVNYKVTFTESDASGVDDGAYFVNKSNRIQYALTIGGGFYLDLINGARLMFDLRYNWGHSNMGFNKGRESNDGKTIFTGNEKNIPESGYQENYEYTHNTLSLSVAYMFEYDLNLKRKGSSTDPKSKKTKRFAKKKRRN